MREQFGTSPQYPMAHTSYTYIHRQGLRIALPMPILIMRQAHTQFLGY